MDKDKKHAHPTSPAGGSAAQPARVPEPGSELDEFFRKLQPEMRRPKPSPDAIAAAVESVNRLAAQANAEEAAESSAHELDLQSLVESNDPERLHVTSNDLGGNDSNDDAGIVLCGVCGHKNHATNRFCGMCGVVIEGAALAAPKKNSSPSRPRKPAPRYETSRSEASILPAYEAETKASQQPQSQVVEPHMIQPQPMHLPVQAPIQVQEERHANGHPETHHYHHHYHHHYFPVGHEGMAPSANSGMSAPSAASPTPRAADPAREAERFRSTAALRGDMSRAEAAVRRIAQEWVLACNTRHLDDLLELYGSDGLVLRSNLNPIRGAAAVREFFFGSLDAGLGEVELEPLRVDVIGDLAYEAGRFKALVPGSTGKRREERGKYLWVLARQSNGEWKIVSDCWSSDLTFGTLESEAPQGAPIRTGQPRKA